MHSNHTVYDRIYHTLVGAVALGTTLALNMQQHAISACFSGIYAYTIFTHNAHKVQTWLRRLVGLTPLAPNAAEPAGAGSTPNDDPNDDYAYFYRGQRVRAPFMRNRAQYDMCIANVRVALPGSPHTRTCKMVLAPNTPCAPEIQRGSAVSSVHFSVRGCWGDEEHEVDMDDRVQEFEVAGNVFGPAFARYVLAEHGVDTTDVADASFSYDMSCMTMAAANETGKVCGDVSDILTGKSIELCEDRVIVGTE